MNRSGAIRDLWPASIWVAAWVAVVILAVLALLLDCAPMDSDSLRNARRDQATLQAHAIEKAIRAYHDHGGKYPDSLDDLVTPAIGRPPPLEGGGSAITDPWGKPFQFEAGTDDKGNEHVVVWTTNPEGERIQWPRK